MTNKLNTLYQFYYKNGKVEKRELSIVLETEYFYHAKNPLSKAVDIYDKSYIDCEAIDEYNNDASVFLTTDDEQKAINMLYDFFIKKRDSHRDISQGYSIEAYRVYELKRNYQFDYDEACEKARHVKNLEELNDFIKKTMGSPNLDYSGYPQAITACCIATLYACDTVGMTGYQASFIPLWFLQEVNGAGRKVGFRVMNYDDMLYPQYGYKFEKTIPKDTADLLVEEAKKLIEERGYADSVALVDTRVLNHWESIAAGNLPFGYSVEED